MAQNKLITAEDLYRFQVVMDARISPDGKQVIMAVQRVERKTEKKFTNLWLVSTTGGRPQQFTYGDQVDAMPRWSPNGRSIAFLSNRKDEKQMQIYTIPVDGGEARPLTDLKGTIDRLFLVAGWQDLIVQLPKERPRRLRTRSG